MRITSVLDCHPLVPAVVAAGRTDAVRPLQVAAPWARLERDVRRLVVRAAGTLLPFRCPSLRDGHGRSFSVAGLALESGERLPARIPRRRAAAGARVQVFATARAQPAAILSAHYPLPHRQPQPLAHPGPESEPRPVLRHRGGVRVLPGA